MDDALATGNKEHILTWAVIKERKYFLEFEPSPLLDEKGSIIGVLETIKDLTGQKLALQAVHDLVVKAKAGELSARANVKAEGDYKLLVDGVNEMLDAVIGPLNVAAEYVDRISKGDIPPVITDSYNGDFNEIKNNLNSLHRVDQRRCRRDGRPGGRRFRGSPDQAGRCQEVPGRLSGDDPGHERPDRLHS